MNTFQKFIKDQELTKKQICEKMEVSRMTLYRWERAVTMPERIDLEKMCKVFKTSLPELRHALADNYVNYLQRKDFFFFGDRGLTSNKQAVTK